MNSGYDIVYMEAAKVIQHRKQRSAFLPDFDQDMRFRIVSRLIQSPGVDVKMRTL